MASIKTILYFLILSLTVVSCTEPIDIALNNSYTRLVVDGAITTDTMAHTIRLSTTSSYYYNLPAPAVSGARVSITDGEQTFTLHEDSAGVYRTATSVYGVEGRTYTLRVELASPIGGNTEYSAFSTLYPVANLDSISLQFHADWSKLGIWEIKCYVLEPPTVDFYRFLISKNEQILTDTLDEWIITDDKFINGNYTNGLPIGYLDQDKAGQVVSPGDTIGVEINCIGKEYYDFIANVQTELFGSNPLFSGPPANVKGNISNGGVGFFAAYSATRSTAIVPTLKK
jgi:hypothetical protein